MQQCFHNICEYMKLKMSEFLAWITFHRFPNGSQFVNHLDSIGEQFCHVYIHCWEHNRWIISPIVIYDWHFKNRETRKRHTFYSSLLAIYQYIVREKSPFLCTVFFLCVSEQSHINYWPLTHVKVLYIGPYLIHLLANIFKKYKM